MTRLNRNDIVAGAGRRFATHGYHGTSMRDLGDDLGILGSSLYSHVGGKQELLVAVVERGAAFFEQAAADALEMDEAPQERMRGLVSGHIGVLLDHRPEARTYLTEVDFLGDKARRRVNENRDRYEEAFRSTIADGITQGVFRPDCNPRLGAIYVLSILNALDRWYDEEGRLTRREVAEDIYRFVISGLS
ncbi:MAG: TetR/AcrR family transcriptional regulator [Acidimicrobiia bacterium]